MRMFLCFWLGLVVSAMAASQSASWQATSGILARDVEGTLSLVFLECAPEGEPAVPSVQGLEFGKPSRSTQFQMLNFQASRRTTLAYPVIASQAGRITIPEFTVATDKGSIRVPAFSMTVSDGQAGSTAAGGGGQESRGLSAGVRFSKTEVWQGEPFDIDYIVLVGPNLTATLAGPVEWKPEGLLVEEWSEPTETQTVVKGEQWSGVRFHTRAAATRSGQIDVPPPTQRLNMESERRTFGLFGIPERRALVVRADPPPSLIVRPLPSPAPAGFTGAIGQFQLEGKAIPEKVKVGEPITWSLKLSGVGNWNDIHTLPKRQASADFRLISPQTHRERPAGSLFNGSISEDVVLIPTKPGSYTLPSVHFSYFDTVSGSYRDAVTDPIRILVEASAVVSSPAQGVPMTAQSPPPVPQALPGDPQEGSAKGWAPLGSAWLGWGLSVPWVILVLAWLGMGRCSSLRMDPERPRLLACHEIVGALDEWGAGIISEQEAALRWRAATGRVWGLLKAEPSFTDILQTISDQAGQEAGMLWSDLWQQSDEVLFRLGGQMPTDWSARARQAVWAAYPRPTPWHHTVRLSRLLPLFFFVVVGCWAAESPQRGAIELYRSGDPASAGRLWSEALRESPSDWKTRHNLGLAMAQQSRWQEAAVFMTGARLLHARDESLNADLVLAFEKAGWGEAPLSRMMKQPSAWRFCSPSEFQFLAGIGCVLVALSIGRWLAHRHGLLGFTFSTPWVVLGGVVLLLLGGVGISSYGPLASPSSVVVWRDATMRSIPTDLDKQQSSLIPAGSVGQIVRTFPGWVRVVLSQGVSGWMRQEEILPLYQSPPRENASSLLSSIQGDGSQTHILLQ